MKLKKIILPFLLTLSLASCQLFDSGSDYYGSNSECLNSDSTIDSVEIDSTEQSSIEKPDTITVFAINDLHGCLKENISSGELGVARLDYAIKHDVDYDSKTSIIISSGDSWQGGYLAHMEKTITDELLGQMGVQAMCLGNHEFDWGIDVIKELKEQSPFPFLACNIKNPNGKHTNELSDNSTIIEKAGLKIGVIGAIGSEQESSIATNSLSGYSFSEDLNYIDTEITNLQSKNCDLIVLSVHDSCNESSNYVTSIGNRFDTTQIQGIFGAHTHSFEKETVGSNQIPFLQGGCNSYGYSKMTFSIEKKKVIDYSYVKAYSGYYNVEDSQLNQNIVELIASEDGKYNGDEEIFEAQGTFRRYYELNKFIPEIMLNQAIFYNWKSSNELIAIHNLAGIRSNISSGMVTREMLYKVEPFDNKVKIIKNISGSKIASLLGNIKGTYQSQYDAYMCESNESFDSSKTYDVVTIDYVSEGNYGQRIFGNAVQYDIRSDDPMILSVMIDYFSRQENKTYRASDYN